MSLLHLKHSEAHGRLLLLLKCCFTSTETAGLLGTGAQDSHLDFHTAPELSMSGGVYVPWVYTRARWELPYATQVFVLVWRLSSAD